MSPRVRPFLTGGESEDEENRRRKENLENREEKDDEKFENVMHRLKLNEL